MELGTLLPRFRLTRLEICLMVSLSFSCFLVCSFLVFSVICYGVFCLYVANNCICILVLIQIWGYINSFCSFCVCFKSVQVYAGVFLVCIISTAVVILASFALSVQFLLPCNRAGRTSVVYSFIFVFCKVLCGLNILLILRVIFKWLFNLLSMSTYFS